MRGKGAAFVKGGLGRDVGGCSINNIYTVSLVCMSWSGAGGVYGVRGEGVWAVGPEQGAQE